MRLAFAAAAAALMAGVALPAQAETPNRAQLATAVKSAHAANLKR